MIFLSPCFCVGVDWAGVGGGRVPCPEPLPLVLWSPLLVLGLSAFCNRTFLVRGAPARAPRSGAPSLRRLPIVRSVFGRSGRVRRAGATPKSRPADTPALVGWSLRRCSSLLCAPVRLHALPSASMHSQAIPPNPHPPPDPRPPAGEKSGRTLFVGWRIPVRAHETPTLTVAHLERNSELRPYGVRYAVGRYSVPDVPP